MQRVSSKINSAEINCCGSKQCLVSFTTLCRQIGPRLSVVFGRVFSHKTLDETMGISRYAPEDLSQLEILAVHIRKSARSNSVEDRTTEAY